MDNKYAIGFMLIIIFSEYKTLENDDDGERMEMQTAPPLNFHSSLIPFSISNLLRMIGERM